MPHHPGRMRNEDACWAAVERRDAAADGEFYFGVRATGVYCRPSCPARKPLRKNVRFYETPEAAEREGLRACRRCRPADTHAPGANSARIQRLCDYIHLHIDDGSALTLENLSRHAGLS